MLIKNTMDNFIFFLKSNNYSEKSIIIYTHGLKKFKCFLEKSYCIMIENITRKHIVSYFAYLRQIKSKGKKLSNNTISKHISIVKHYFNYLFNQDIILNDYSGYIPGHKHKKQLPKNILSPEDIEKICSAVNMQSLTGYRDRIIIEIMYTVGLRVGETSNLKVSDIDLKNEVLTVHEGKGRKSRVLPIPATLHEFLKQYITKVRPFLSCYSKRSYLIISKDGKKISPSNITARLKKYGEKAGIKVTSHMFRHAFSTHLLQKGCDIKYISVLLGHESLETTQVYTEISDKELKEKLAEYHFLLSDYGNLFPFLI